MREKRVAGMAGIAGSKFIGRLSLILRSFGNLQTCKTCHTCHTCHNLPYLPHLPYLPQPAMPCHVTIINKLLCVLQENALQEQ